MAMDVEQTPFLKQLVDSDPELRNKAFTSLRTYLTSGRAFDDQELLKLWKGLYYSLYHTPLTQARPLLSALTDLHLALPLPQALPFARAFWLTMGLNMPNLDAHRMDKFLLLQRQQLSAQLASLARSDWPPTALASWLKMMSDPRDGPLGRGGPGERMGDGVRYHVLDVLGDELCRVAANESASIPPAVCRQALAPVAALAQGKRNRALHDRAAEVLADARLLKLCGKKNKGREQEGDEEEWSGVED